MIGALRWAVVIPVRGGGPLATRVVDRLPVSVDRVFVVGGAGANGDADSPGQDARLCVISHAAGGTADSPTLVGMQAALRDGAEVIVIYDPESGVDPSEVLDLARPIADSWADRVKPDTARGFRVGAWDARQIFLLASATAVVLCCIALADLALRAALRLELRWDTFLYHLPFAALRGGLDLPYEMSDRMQPLYQGFPRLPHLVQGLLWRLTGSMNATGVVNLLALGGFLAYCQRFLRAPFWLVGLISLTAPTVLIQCSASYVDLFGNSFLAAGAAACLFSFLFPAETTRGVLLGGLAGLIAAAWSKFQLVPVVALVALIGLGVALRPARIAGLARRQVALAWGIGMLLAAAPYLQNIILYHNPFWPLRLPIIGDHVPYARDALAEGPENRPPSMRDASQFRLFMHSLFEIDHPMRYASRPRWIIDQGNANIAFRMGGFWGFAAAAYLVMSGALLVICRRRSGVVAALGLLGALAFVAVLPQSHELRYYMFIPLTGAALIGMLLPRVRSLVPRTATALLVFVLGAFLYMVSENRMHYVIEPVDQAAAAHYWGADGVWPRLERGHTYCAVNVKPFGILLTGPTLSEYHIVERSSAALCPPGVPLLPH